MHYISMSIKVSYANTVVPLTEEQRSRANSPSVAGALGPSTIPIVPTPIHISLVLSSRRAQASQKIYVPELEHLLI